MVKGGIGVVNHTHFLCWSRTISGNGSWSHDIIEALHHISKFVLEEGTWSVTFGAKVSMSSSMSMECRG